MKLARDIAALLLLMAVAAKADYSPTIRQLDSVDDSNYRLRVYCDSPRGNMVYLAHDSSGIGVAVIHQPEMCK